MGSKRITVSDRKDKYVQVNRHGKSGEKDRALRIEEGLRFMLGRKKDAKTESNRKRREDGKRHLEVECTNTCRLLLKTAAQVGASSLGIYRLIFRERFYIMGLTNMFDKIRQGL